jgi:hypothetical protein
VEKELRQLAIVAFAMFNRGSQWIDETDVESDLAAIFGAAPIRVRSDLRIPLKASELLLGRFFFVHRARASMESSLRRETYEFPACHLRGVPGRLADVAGPVRCPGPGDGVHAVPGW